MTSTIRQFVFVLTVLILGTPHAWADLTLDPIEVLGLYPEQSTIYSGVGTQTVDPVATFQDVEDDLTFIVGASTITITSNFDGIVEFNQADFNGFSFTDTTGTANITGVTVDPATRNFSDLGNPSRYTFDSSTVFVNLENSGFTFQGESLILDLQFAPQATVPEPSSLMLVCVGVAMGLCYVWRRRRDKAKAVRLPSSA